MSDMSALVVATTDYDIFTLIQFETGPSTQSDVFISAAGIFETKTFPAGSSSITFYFDLTDDNVGLEAVESYIASLQIVGSPLGIQTGSLVQTTVIVEDDDRKFNSCISLTL